MKQTSLDIHFRQPVEEIPKILEKALSKGGDFSELFFEHREKNSINMEEGIIKETSEIISLGVGIRVISEGKTGFGYTSDLILESKERAALTAASIASGHLAQGASPLRVHMLNNNFYPIRKPAHRASLKNKFEIVRKAYRTAMDTDPKIKKALVTLNEEIQHVTVANSEGLVISDSRPLVQLLCLCIAEKSGMRESGFSGGGGRVGLEYLTTERTPEEIGRDAAREALLMLEAVLPPAGEMPVVLAPGHSGVLIHEAVGHLLEADFNRKKTSIFWNKAGKTVGRDLLNIYDDPTIPFFRGSYNVDDEGTIPKKIQLIQKGKLVGFLQDRLSARLMNEPLTGHGRRQDYTCIPIPRMSNTYIDRGEHSPEEILKSVPKGFYARTFQGGQVEDSGKFTFSVSSGYLIEGGNLTAPIKHATLIGTNIDILKGITMVGSDLLFGLQTGTCEKEGQAAPVTDGCPTIKISKMTVGGRM